MGKPRLRADYRRFRLAGPGGDFLLAVGEHRNLLIDDPVVVAVADGLDGTRTADEVATALSGEHPARQVARALRRLRRLDLVADGASDVPADRTAGWDARGVDPDGAERFTQGGAVDVVDLGVAGLTDFVACLATLGFHPRVLPPTAFTTDDPVEVDVFTEHRGPGADRWPDAYRSGEIREAAVPVVVAVDSMVDDRLAPLNAALLAAGRAWTMVRPVGNVVLLGPHLVPGTTGCWQCLRQRWVENDQIESFLRANGSYRTAAPAAALPAVRMMLAGLLGAELPVLALAGASPRLTGRMVSVDSRDLTVETHELVRQPQCPACGDPTLLAAGPRVVVGDAPLRARAEAGSRQVPAEEAYQRLGKHVSRYLGAVNRLVALESDEHGLRHSYIAGHNFAQARTPYLLRRNLRGLSGGKGRTDLQARVSAIGEAIERYSAVWRDDRPVWRAPLAELGAEAVPPNELLGFSDRQYAERDATNPTLGHFHRVPNALRPDVPIDWTEGWSLSHERSRLVPAAYCWYGHPEISDPGVCAADSNGCAAGTGLGEAILQGFCELVERDAVALWWYHRSLLPGVDLDSFADPWISRLRQVYRDELHRELWALDLTADLGVPTFAAVSRVLGRPTEDIVIGFGAHPEPSVALNRALTEVNQFLPMVARLVDGRTRYGDTDPETVRWYRTARLAGQPWLAPDPAAAATTADTHPVRRFDTEGAAVDWCVEVARGAGLEVIVVDQTRPDLDLAVAKVIVPGLRHFWRRLGPGRLWQVPARLHRAPRAGQEGAVNPLNVFF